ncbi:hypothetical protein J2738_000368 [Variovorax paradoxus]|jgi:hypothetical protein|uniref:DUF2798 domain-containing protein n=1 Tax=Variovorax paradoxus TaxID=34073 RepID=A0AAE4BTQ2_VARPD|nr:MULTISPECIES: DUF2798 domain-containing protein [Variovorax]MBD9663822.1 DUF2798 domain-containing protein [Variovorax sp. VRV01]MDR6424246.1 hypothetical protein [Variovorax paradoxus]MDR6452480.1 hypothetical protein [Variovorax paradoxus]
MNRRKLPARYAGIVMPFFLSVFMSCIVAGVSTLKSVGLASGLLQMWMSAWGVSWLVAFPSLLVVLPVVRRLVAATVQEMPKR